MYAAVGLLECLWHLTANEAPRGDIGKLSDDDIAMFVDWERDGAELVRALHDAGWLDHSTEHRLIIHDWPAHCDDSVDARVFRMGESYADGTPARGKKVGEKEKQSIAARITPKPRPEPEPARKIAGNDFTPSEVAMAIIQDAQAGGPRVLIALTDIAKSVMASGLTAEAARDKMLGRWNEYKQAATQMKWTYSGIEKFFAGGMWDKPEAWPWAQKERAQPGYNPEMAGDFPPETMEYFKNKGLMPRGITA